MAVIYGFKFASGAFFNGLVSPEDGEKIKGENPDYWLTSNIVPLLSKEHGLDLEREELASVVEGGFADCPGIGQLCRHPSTTPATTSSEPVAGGSQATDKQVWTDRLTRLLVETRRQLAQKFQSPLVKKKEAWELVAKAINSHGYTVSPLDCDKKYRDLRRTYHHNHQRAKQSGAGAVRWPFFDLMRDVLEGDPTVEPVALVASLTLPTTRLTVSSAATSVTSSTTPISPSTSQATSSSTSLNTSWQVEAEASSPPLKKRKRAEAAMEAALTEQDGIKRELEGVLQSVQTAQQETLALLRESLRVKNENEKRKLDLLTTMTSVLVSLVSSSAASSSAAHRPTMPLQTFPPNPVFQASTATPTPSSLVTVLPSSLSFSASPQTSPPPGNFQNGAPFPFFWQHR